MFSNLINLLNIFCANMRACDFSTITRIRTHNLSLTRILPYHWATPLHVANNDIFFFYYYFQMSYIIHFTAIMISNKNLFNYKVVDLVVTYNFYIFLSICGHLKILKIWTMYLGAKTTSTGKNFNYKVVDRVESYNFCIDYFLI